MLQVNALNQFYGGSHILRDVSFEVPQGKLTTLLGRNGVGKSTLLKCLMGVVPTRSGHISWDGKALERKAPYERVSAGLGYVPQGREIFPRLTVEENLLIGAASRGKPSGVPDRIYQLFPVLRTMRQRRGGDLSGGQQQQLAIGRALMSKPRMIILDEPSLGLAPIIIQQIFEIIGQLREEGITVFLVEQNAHQALSLADRGYVLETGRIRLHDTGKNLLANPEVRDAYLGG